MRKNYIDASKINLEKIKKMRADVKPETLSCLDACNSSSSNCSNDCVDDSKNNLKKIKEIRDTGKLKKLQEDVRACSNNIVDKNQRPIPIWYPKNNPVRLRDLPDIPTYKITGSFDKNTSIIIDGGSP